MRVASVRYLKVHPDAVIPKHQTEGAACVDFHSVEEGVVEPGKAKAFATGLKIQLPYGTELQMRSRSGLFLKNILVVGTIDCDYRGEVKLMLANLGTEPFKVEKGMRVAQGKLSHFIQQTWTETDQLGESVRGEGGFGSTGVHA